MLETQVDTSASAAKARVRAEALTRRRAAPDAARVAFAERLAREGVRLALGHSARVASAFHPIRGEPETLPLLAALAAAGVATSLPVTRAPGERLLFRFWKPGDATAPGALGIAEPLPSALEVQPDLLFVPLAAFDRRGHRIGFGAGYYDRTLAALREQRPTLAVGVAFATSEVAATPDEPHDERLDFIITENETISARGHRP